MGPTALADWHEFFSFVGLVAGGLTGLIFVALSIQIGDARSGRAYVTRARTTLHNLTGILVLSGMALIPGQSLGAFGIEAAALLLLLVWDIVRTVRAFELPGERLGHPVLVRTVLALLTLGLGLAGCVALVAGRGDGLILVAGSALLGLPVRIEQAWALLEGSLTPVLVHEVSRPGSAEAPQSAASVDTASQGTIDS